MKFDPLDESDVLAAERVVGMHPNATGRLRMFRRDGEIHLLQLWTGSGRGIWLEVPVVDDPGPGAQF